MKQDEEKTANHGLQNGKSCVDGSKNIVEEHVPPDGGCRAWMVLIASFLCNGILFGVINSYSVIQDTLYTDLKADNITEASSKAALVGSLAMGSTFLLSAVAGVLTDYIGLRTTCFIGGALASSGMLLSSFFTKNVSVLYFTYGIMYGVGGALSYTPSLVILGHYFKRYIGIVNGVVTAGSSIFTMAMPYIIGYFLEISYLMGTLRILAIVSAFLMLCAVIFKPLVKKAKDEEKRLSNAFNASIWKNKKYVTWAGIIAMSLCGYFVPYVHMSTFVNENFEKDTDTKLPIICIGLTSGIGRLLFGYIADRPGVNRIYLQQISFVVIGLSTILLPLTKGAYPWLLLITLVMGLFDGCFVALMGPIAFDICGQSGATQAIGFMLGLSSIPLTLGPYIAGILYDHLGSYTLAFRIAGVPPIIGGLAMFAIKFLKDDKKVPYTNGVVKDVTLSGKVNSRSYLLTPVDGCFASPRYTYDL